MMGSGVHSKVTRKNYLDGADIVSSAMSAPPPEVILKGR